MPPLDPTRSSTPSEATTVGRRLIVVVVFMWTGASFLLALESSAWFGAALHAACLVGLALRREWAVAVLWLTTIWGFIFAVAAILSEVSGRELTPIDTRRLVYGGVLPLIESIGLSILFTREAVMRWVAPQR